MYVIIKNYVNWHRENLSLDREKTGKTQGISKYNLSGYPALSSHLSGHNNDILLGNFELSSL